MLSSAVIAANVRGRDLDLLDCVNVEHFEEIYAADSIRVDGTQMFIVKGCLKSESFPYCVESWLMEDGVPTEWLGHRLLPAPSVEVAFQPPSASEIKSRILDVLKQFGPLSKDDISDVAPYASSKQITFALLTLSNEGNAKSTKVNGEFLWNATR